MGTDQGFLARESTASGMGTSAARSFVCVWIAFHVRLGRQGFAKVGSGCHDTCSGIHHCSRVNIWKFKSCKRCSNTFSTERARSQGVKLPLGTTPANRPCLLTLHLCMQSQHLIQRRQTRAALCHGRNKAGGMATMSLLSLRGALFYIWIVFQVRPWRTRLSESRLWLPCHRLRASLLCPC